MARGAPSSASVERTRAATRSRSRSGCTVWRDLARKLEARPGRGAGSGADGAADTAVAALPARAHERRVVEGDGAARVEYHGGSRQQKLRARVPAGATRGDHRV